ncbi:hypothetical protein APR11_003159 [Nocardia amikacinitolerans]|nr:hypothetical protein [Nocardia amikacinitolerans]
MTKARVLLVSVGAARPSTWRFTGDEHGDTEHHDYTHSPT